MRSKQNGSQFVNCNCATLAPLVPITFYFGRCDSFPLSERKWPIVAISDGILLLCVFIESKCGGCFELTPSFSLSVRKLVCWSITSVYFAKLFLLGAAKISCLFDCLYCLYCLFFKNGQQCSCRKFYESFVRCHPSCKTQVCNLHLCHAHIKTHILEYKCWALQLLSFIWNIISWIYTVVQKKRANFGGL